MWPCVCSEAIRTEHKIALPQSCKEWRLRMCETWIGSTHILVQNISAQVHGEVIPAEACRTGRHRQQIWSGLITVVYSQIV